MQISLPSLTLEQEFNLGHDNEAWKANLNKDKRIMNWQPLLNKVYALFQNKTAWEVMFVVNKSPHSY